MFFDLCALAFFTMLLSGCDCQGGMSDKTNATDSGYHNSSYLNKHNSDTVNDTKVAALLLFSHNQAQANSDLLMVKTDTQVAQKQAGQDSQNTMHSAHSAYPNLQNLSKMKFTVGEPVHYDTRNWSNGDNKTILVTELPIIRANLTGIIDIDENSLDYSSHPATKYRYSQTDAPYLDLVDSEKFLEFGWYFANPDDSHDEKITSINHAKHIFNMSRYLMGTEGEKLVIQMLHGQITKDKKVGGVQVELAKCEFYNCMLIINKTLTPIPQHLRQ